MIGPRATKSIAQFRAGGGAGQPSPPCQLCDCELDLQNEIFAGTGGVSEHSRAAGFAPAYQNSSTGEAVVSCFADGRPAPVHLLEGLPEAWVAARDEHGQVSAALDTVVAGFIRDGVFFTRADAARLVAQEAAAPVQQASGRLDR